MAKFQVGMEGSSRETHRAAKSQHRKNGFSLVILCICLTVVHCCFEWTYFGPLCLAVAGNVAQIMVYNSGLPPFISGHSSSSSRNIFHGVRYQSHCLILEVSCAEHPGKLSAL